MPEPERVLTVIREWLLKAENDLRAAAHLAKLKENCPTDVVCFHAQQCVEKYLKAVLVLHLVDFPRTHDLAEIIALLPARLRPRLTPEQLRKFKQYAVAIRYPGLDETPLTEARRAIVLARRIRKEIRAALPKEAFKPRRR
jgi:HEPN domain-containing protein